jgi:uncharacterized LabA/DUF88 family protein
VDGFNLYYGLVKDGPHKWLDLEKYFTMLRPDDHILKILYFTSLIDGPRKQNQEEYLRALRTCHRVEIVLGKFMKRTVTCRVPSCRHQGSRQYTTTEEKGTDVNIAVRMLDDAHNDRCDNLILVSGDSDLAPVLSLVRRLFPLKRIITYIPAKASAREARYSRSLHDHSHKLSFLPESTLGPAQFPATLTDSNGAFQKPASW